MLKIAFKAIKDNIQKRSRVVAYLTMPVEEKILQEVGWAERNETSLCGFSTVLAPRIASTMGFHMAQVVRCDSESCSESAPEVSELLLEFSRLVLLSLGLGCTRRGSYSAKGRVSAF